MADPRDACGGLRLVEVQDRGPRSSRLLASGTHPVYAAGSAIMHVRVTTTGRRVLRRARKELRVAVRHDVRDILTATTTGVTKGRRR